MARELFSRDDALGLETWFDYDEATDTAYLSVEQDVEPILEANKILYNDTDRTNAGIKGDFWHYGSIPVNIVHKWLIEDGVDFFDKNDHPKVLSLLNDPQYRFLKVTHKHHE